MARAHLDLLVEAGFLDTRLRRKGKGRPAKVYFTWEGEMDAPDEWEISPPADTPEEEMVEEVEVSPPAPNPHRLIAQIFVQLVERIDLPDLYELADEVAREQGAKLMLDYRDGGLDFPAAIRAMVEEFRRFSPGARVVEIDPDYAEIEIADCPFRDIALEHADVVLVVDPALKAGAMEALGHPSDIEVESSVARGDATCRVIIRRQSKASKGRKAKK